MSQISKQVLFNAPLDTVWKIFMDVEKNTEWVEGVGTSIITSAVKYGPGLSWEENCLFDGKNIPMEHKMVLWEEKKKVVIRTGLPMGGSMEKIVEFCGDASQTQVSLELEWDLGIAASFLGEDFVQNLLEKNLGITAANWKTRAENF